MSSLSHSRRPSISNSILSTTSTHLMIPKTNELPSPPKLASTPPYSLSRSTSPLSKSRSPDGSAISLTVNYLPHKFSSTLLASGPRKRKGKGDELIIPKLGGGVEAFKSGEARMPGETDDEYDGTPGLPFGNRPPRSKKPRWNRFKWVLFITNSLLTIYTVTGLIMCLLTWLDVWSDADIIRTGNRPELIISTIGACIGIITSLVGWAGILLNNRAFLAMYSFLLWIVFAFLVTPGYITYKRRTFNIEGKINAQWSRALGVGGRLKIQNRLACCGYFSPFVEATVSQTCYARSVLPGCKMPYIAFEHRVLAKWYTVIFSLVPVHIFIMVAGLMCSNHVTYRFGKGMMPKAYRLSMNSMAVIMDNYANQLAEQYGPDVATDIINRSRSNLQLDSMPTTPYSTNGQTFSSSIKYNSIGTRAPEPIS